MGLKKQPEREREINLEELARSLGRRERERRKHEREKKKGSGRIFQYRSVFRFSSRDLSSHHGSLHVPPGPAPQAGTPTGEWCPGHRRAAAARGGPDDAGRRQRGRGEEAE